jgi:hypothetical protein
MTPDTKADYTKWVVLQDPNKGFDQYYAWRESTYSKYPNIGFISKIDACYVVKKLNQI